MLVEFGTEMNGFWFPWNGKWNGAGATTGYGDPALPDGPERFRDAYRHVHDVIASQARQPDLVLAPRRGRLPADTLEHDRLLLAGR